MVKSLDAKKESAQSLFYILAYAITNCGNINVKAPSSVSLQNNKAIPAIDLFGGAIVDFHLKSVDVNPFLYSLNLEKILAMFY